jgi:hypothetical protein
MAAVSSLIADSRASIVDTFQSLTKASREAVAKPSERRIRVAHDEILDQAPLSKGEEERPSLWKSLTNLLNGPSKSSVERLAFETDPSNLSAYQSLYRPKTRGVPDSILKRIIIQDDLVAAIVRTREVQVGAFGRQRPDRFSTGFVIEPRAGVVDRLTPEQKAELDRRIERAVDLFATCGHTDDLKLQEQMPFSAYLRRSARNGIGVGRLATEIVYRKKMDSKEKEFHHFRPVDAGTIYKAASQKSAEDNIREQARQLLERIKGDKIMPERYLNDEYAWCQVIDGAPKQFFTDDELVVHNFYPVNDIEMDGYPVTPIDTAIAAVTTHINITTHNKMYFQTGRATRGMLVFKSDDVDENTLARVKQQFQASINSVNNAWRMPVFAVGANDEISWEPIDNSGRDAEFQYLTDMNARVILSAFQMSPDELPGWSYLSKGTNNQALSESNNEYRLEAARDLGIKPLLTEFEDFINATIFPLVDPVLCKIARLKLKGLDADTEEKESIRLQQDSPVHGTYDWILGKVEKKPVGKAMGGEFPLNPQYQAIIDKYLPVGAIKEFFFGIEGASKDPELQYYRDPFWFQAKQLQMQAQQMAQQQAQAAQAQQQAAGPGAANSEQPEASGVSDSEQPDDGGSKAPTENQKDQQVQDGAPQAPNAGGAQDLTRSIDQALAALTKGEQNLPASKRKLLAQQRRTIEHFRLGLENELRATTREILDVADKHTRK